MLNQISEIRIEIIAPMIPLKKAENKLFIEVDRKEEFWEYNGAPHVPVDHPTTTYEEGLAADEITATRLPLSRLKKTKSGYLLTYINNHATWIDIRARIDLFGDGKVSLPYEPSFKGSKLKGDGTRWIASLNLCQRPRVKRNGSHSIEGHIPDL